MRKVYYYVCKRYGTAGPGASHGYAWLVESDEPLETYYEHTESLSGPYDRAVAERVVADANKAFRVYAESH